MKFNSKMLSVAAATALIVTMTGCGSTATSASKTGGTQQQITNPKGSVTGTVQDTNGNPIQGVKVYLAGQNTTTDAGGIYNFASVPVTQVNNIAAGVQGEKLSVTIAAPTGYIGATVTVSPTAQVTNDSNTTNGVKTFIDGFVASAGTAVLPETNSTVSGVLRDTDTEAPLANTEIKFEFTAGGTAANVVQEQKQNGVETSYAVSTYTLTTDENGSFSFASLPTDSTFKLLVPGYDNVDAGGPVGSLNQFSSDAETVITLGNVVAKKITALDTKDPFIVSVNNVISAPTALRAVLDDDTRNTFVVNFSEALAPAKLELTGNSVLLYAGKDGNMIKRAFTAAINTADNAITFTTTDTFADGDFVDLLFLNADTVDTSMNPLAVNANIGYDELKGNYTRVKLEIFSEENTNAAAATATAQLDKDTHGTNEFAKLQALSDAFNNVQDGIGKIYQLNSAANDDSIGGLDSAERLTALSTALGGGTVLTDIARISFTAANANSYIVTVENKSGVEKTIPAITGTDALTYDGISTALGTNDKNFGAGANPKSLIITPATNVQVEIVLASVTPSDVVVITPTDSLGYPGTAKRITLVDNVAPTTVLQKSYLNGTPTVEKFGAVAQFGDGGELSQNADSTIIGAPYLAINASLLDDLNANGDNVNVGNVTRDKKLTEELYKYNTVNPTTGKSYIPKSVGVYDATAYPQFTARLNRTIGIAFSEDVNLTGTPATIGMTTAVTNATVYNNVVNNVDNTAIKINSDLVMVDVADVMTLANSDDGKVIDFTNVIKDTAGNIAGANTNAKVVVKDMMPPMVVTATYSGANVVINFNEPITLYDAASGNIPQTSVTLTGSATATATYNPNDLWVLSPDKKQLSIPYSDFTADKMNINSFWDKGTYGYASNSFYSVTSILAHAYLTTNKVTDSHKNSWTTYIAATTPRNITAPQFAATFTVANFSDTAVTTNFKGTDNTNTTAQTVVWNFTQPLHVNAASDLFQSANQLQADGSYEITSLTTIQGFFEGFVTTGSTTSAITNNDASKPTKVTLSADKKTLTLIFTTADNLVAGDIVRMKSGKNMTSDYDRSQIVNGNSLTATAQ